MRHRHSRPTRLALAAAALGLAPAPAAAQPDERAFHSVWLIAPGEEPAGRRRVEDGGYVFRQRLLPPSLVRLDSDARDPGSGRVVAAAGTQLYGLVTRGPPIYCVVGRRDPSVAGQLLLGGMAGNTQICMADMDRDGRFDVRFNVRNQIRGVPNIAGRRPRDPDAVAGGAYSELPPASIATLYFVGVRYEGMLRFTSTPTPIFRIWFGTDESREDLTEIVRPLRGSNPPLVTPLGAQFTVTEMRGSSIEVEISRPIPPQPFAVLRTVTYR